MKLGRARGAIYSLGSFILPLLLFCLIWELISHSGLVKPILIPPPSKVFLELFEDRAEILTHLVASLKRLVLGYSLAALAGVALGISMGYNKYVHGYFHPIISTLMPVPGITWAPILVLVLGFGDPTLVTVTFIASLFPVVYNTSAGVSSIRKDHLWAARIMGASRFTIFSRVLLPSSAPFILTGLKLGLARAWRTLIAVEMIAATLWGLGFFIFDAKEYLRTSDIYAGIVVMAIVFIIIERTSFGTMEKRTIEKWGMVRDIG